MSDDALPQSSIILYQTEDGRTRIECRFEDETIWLTQALIAELFQKDVRTINEHLTNIYDEGELDLEPTIRKFRIVRQEGNREVAREIEHYSLPAILAVGYRVRSQRGTQFRQWVYLRVREIVALATDYQPTEPQTQLVFQTVQNKLHFASTGMTAPELIARRADAGQSNMGLTSWKGGVVRKADVTVAKNYLRQEEIEELNRIVVTFLDYAEDQAMRRNLH